MCATAVERCTKSVSTRIFKDSIAVKLMNNILDLKNQRLGVIDLAFEQKMLVDLRKGLDQSGAVRKLYSSAKRTGKVYRTRINFPPALPG